MAASEARPIHGLPPDARALVDLLVERLGMATGRGRVEIEIGANGQVHVVWLHRAIGPTQLERF